MDEANLKGCNRKMVSWRRNLAPCPTMMPSEDIARGAESPEPAVSVAGLRKSYGAVAAVNGISFEICRGEVFGLLGPNGAGKTSTIEILEGLRRPDAGCVRVCGLEPANESAALKERIGAQLQATVLPDKIRVEEALVLFAGFYRRALPPRVLLERFGLADKRRSYFERLSGGQKQRVALALALVNDPDLVLLDEPTAGLDAAVRRDIYDLIASLRAERRTVLLTTHYIEEAERLCDRVAVMDQGRIVALGPPRQLVERSGLATELEIRLLRPAEPGRLAALEGVLACAEAAGVYRLQVGAAAPAVVALVRFLDRENSALLDLRISQPSLEDAFLRLTGRRIQD